MSSKNNVNTDHYKTKGRGRQANGIVYGNYKHRMIKARRRRGLSAKELWERKMNRRSIAQLRNGASTSQV
ncbi:MAG TPA: hypothetical protein VFS76_26220 [Pyrinomonadaceae bacterium]|nr:hypothetical protein [Pyrinomonadaceae bacterium]